MDALVQRLNDALKRQCQQQANFELLTSELPAEDIEFWQHLCQEWLNAPHPKHGIFNPFPSVSRGKLLSHLILKSILLPFCRANGTPNHPRP